jgi:signal transduction histidine kinase
MRANQFPAITLTKFRNPATWVAILVYSVAWSSARVLGVVPAILSPAMEFAVPFLFVTAQVAFAPLPWLWTGDDRPKAPPMRGLLQAIPWNLLWIAAGIGLMVLSDSGLTANLREVQRQASGGLPSVRPEWGLFMVNFPLALILGLFMADKERAESSERNLKHLAEQTRAQVLQAQLNPHVLFNVLGGLTELIHEDPDAAESALVGLIQMYRELTIHSIALTAPLRDERRLIERYLEIEEIRLGQRLEVGWDWPEWADPIELPPLLLQPLVENAIKHSIAPQPKGGALRIAVARKADRLVLSVSNNGASLDPQAREGTGIGNLKERLRLMSRHDPRLELVEEEGWTVARIAFSWEWKP